MTESIHIYRIQNNESKKFNTFITFQNNISDAFFRFFGFQLQVEFIKFELLYNAMNFHIKIQKLLEDSNSTNFFQRFF